MKLFKTILNAISSLVAVCTASFILVCGALATIFSQLFASGEARLDMQQSNNLDSDELSVNHVVCLAEEKS